VLSKGQKKAYCNKASDTYPHQLGKCIKSEENASNQSGFKIIVQCAEVTSNTCLLCRIPFPLSHSNAARPVIMLDSRPQMANLQGLCAAQFCIQQKKRKEKKNYVGSETTPQVN